MTGPYLFILFSQLALFPFSFFFLFFFFCFFSVFALFFLTDAGRVALVELVAFLIDDD